MINIIFVHGWGFNNSLWDKVIAHLPNDSSFTNIDLGFTGKSFQPNNLPYNALCVGHSMGVLWLLKNIKNPAGFISIGGFDCFHRHIPIAQIKAMKRNLGYDLKKQMEEFYRACGVDFQQHKFNKEKLMDGLVFLTKEDETKTLKNLTCPITAINAQDDNIVPISMANAIWSNYTFKAIKEGGHVLPITNPQFCAEQINNMITKIKS